MADNDIVTVNDKLCSGTFELTPVKVEIKLPKVPIRIWSQVMGFMEWACLKQQSEAIVSMTVVDGKWVVIPWHQKASGGLHVKFNQFDDENIRDFGHLEEALNVVHCTIHSHNRIGAGQSGDDAEDELAKRGWHITVGHCHQDRMDFHGRYNFKINAEWNEDGSIKRRAYQKFIKINPEQVISLDLEMYKEYESDFLSVVKHRCSPFPESWKANHTKVASTYQRGGSYEGANGTPHFQGATAWGWEEDGWEDDGTGGLENIPEVPKSTLGFRHLD